MSLVEFSTTPYGRDFFRNVQKISDSLEEIAKSKESKNIHDHRVGAAQRISQAITFIDNTINDIEAEDNKFFLTKKTALNLFETIRTILLKTS